VKIGLDLGKLNDYSALVVAERSRREDGHMHHAVRAVERLPLGTSYPAVADRVRQVMDNLQAFGADREAAGQAGLLAELIVDATGVGVAAADLLRERRLHPVLVTIVAGDRQTAREDGVLSVGKSFLVGRLQVLLQAGRLHLPKTPEAHLLAEELGSYQADFTPSGNVAFHARSGAHDDLVLALALAVAVDVPPSPGPVCYASRRAKGVW
jgi:hypothetical protein